MANENEHQRLTSARATYLSGVVAEIRILIRAIVGDPDKNISTLEVKWRENGQDITLDYPRVIELIAKPPPTDGEAMIARLGQLQAVRDDLIRLTKPATGYSIAYTNLVIGRESEKGAEGIYELATQAYGGLASAAILHRWVIRFLAAAAVLIAIFASWEATKASLGLNLLKALEPLRAQQTALTDDKYKLETGSVLLKESDRTAVFPICDRYEWARKHADADGNVPNSVLPREAAAQIRDVCGRDQILLHNFQIAHEGLKAYLVDWPDMVGGLYTPIHYLADATTTAATVVLRVAFTNVRSAPWMGVAAPGDDDVEFWVAPVLLVTTSYILPFTFGIIGSLLYVLLQHYTSVRANLLVPRDHALAYLRVVLGIVVATSVSLLITSVSEPGVPIAPPATGSTPPSSLVGSLTLTASLITFLAGFGAEAVFTLLQKLVQHVFALPEG